VVFLEAFVVAGAAASPDDPGVGALDDPAAGQHLEAAPAWGLVHELDDDAELPAGPVAPVRVISLIPPDAGQAAPAGRAGLLSGIAPAAASDSDAMSRPGPSTRHVIADSLYMGLWEPEWVRPRSAASYEGLVAVLGHPAAAQQ